MPGAGTGLKEAWISLFLLAGCAAPDEKLTPAQYVEKNSNILERLRSYKESERQEGIERFQRLGREQGSAIILYVLGDPKLNDYRLEVVLARILADWKNPEAIRFLLSNLKALDDGATRIAAEGLLAFQDNPIVLEALEEMLKSPVLRERRTAAETLSKFRGPRVAEVLGPRLRAETDGEVRGLILLGVLLNHHPRRKEFLVDALTDADPAIREEAWRALKKYPDLPRVRFDPNGALEERAGDVATLRLWLKEAKRAER
jgi:hypothetical protein